MKDKENRFLMLPYKLLSASGYIDHNGECVKMTLTEKIIYVHIKNRFEFFKGINKEYYDTQQSIANICNMDLKSVGNILRKFDKSGLITVYKKRSKGYPKNVYTNVPDLIPYYSNKQAKLDSEEVDNYEYPEMPLDFIVDMHDIYEEEEASYDIPDWAK